MASDIFRYAFNDICNGYSSGKVLNRFAYIKHLSHADQLDLESVEKEFYEQAKKRGLPTEEMRLSQLKKEDRWKDSDEKQLTDIKLSIDSLAAGRKNAPLPSILQRVNQQIKEEEDKYNKKSREKNELIGLTVEAASQRRLNEYYIFKNLYADKFFTQPLFSKEDFDDLSEFDMLRIIEGYNVAMEACSDINIKKLSIQDFFQSYYYISGDDFSAFYGRPVCRLTLFQVKLANYAKYFRGIFENHDMRSVPKEILEDPDKIADWVHTTDRAKKEIEKTKEAPMGGVAGMTKQDRKALGVQNDGVDLAKEAAKKGGSLNREDLMKLMGVGPR